MFAVHVIIMKYFLHTGTIIAVIYIYTVADNNIILCGICKRDYLYTRERPKDEFSISFSFFTAFGVLFYLFIFILSHKDWIVLLRFIVKIIIILTPGVGEWARVYLPWKNIKRTVDRLDTTIAAVTSTTYLIIYIALPSRKPNYGDTIICTYI